MKLKPLVKRMLSPAARERLRPIYQILLRRTPLGWARFGNLRRLMPFSRVFGLDRGRCIDRHYIESFLAQHAADIRGRVLEIGDNTYTLRFGGDRVLSSDILHVADGQPGQTLVADLTHADHVPSDRFDCIILTQTLHLIYDLPAVVRTLHRILLPGGVVLVTAPGISQISRFDMDRWGDCWRFTSLSLRRLFAETFGPGADQVQVRAQGNVLTAISFLLGLSAEELTFDELSAHDPDYEVVIGLRAVKREVRTSPHPVVS